MSFKTKGGKKGDDDDVKSFLDGLWDSPIAGLIAANPTPKKRAAQTAVPSPADKLKQRSKSTSDAAARSNQLNLSEQVNFRCKLLIQDLENDATVMQQSCKKVQSTITAIKQRMTDKVMEHYAADYGDWGVAIAGLDVWSFLGIRELSPHVLASVWIPL